MLSFGVVSLVLTVAVGVALGVHIRDSVMARSVRSATAATQSAIAIAINTIATQASYGTNGIPLTVQQRRAQVGAISSGSKILVANSDIVAVEVILPDGTVIGGANGPAIGTKIPSDPGLRAALAGVKRVRTLDANDTSATTSEKLLLRDFGDLLVLEEGVRLTGTGPTVAVVRSYAPLRATRRQAASDTQSIIWSLVLGLLIFWLVLFRLVLGASRTLSRQSKANAYQATHDALTGLPNRDLLRERTERALVATRRTGLHVALILMDLNRFKELNDTFGHPIGDTLLQLIGPRLQEELRDSDTVARVGGDEFVVMLPDLRSPEMALPVAEKLAVALQRPFVLDVATVDVDSSAGLATAPDHGSDFDELLRHADVAMYLAKHDRLQVVTYSPELDGYDPARLSLLADLRRAIEQPDQIVLHYQPQADLATGRIVGVEALVRWRHPQHGLLPPDDFVPLAENTGIIRPLTWCVLRAALEQNRQWARNGLELRVSVNISARSLLDAGFAEHVGRLLEEAGVPADRLELELTETAIMTDPDRSLRILRDLASRGIALSIDDFGTGYSSMAYLKNLPVREIKIDRGFITHMDTDSSDAAIVCSTLDLARDLGLTVVAEGVETQAVRRRLTDLGCPTMQGFLLSKPLAASDLSEWMADHEAAVPDVACEFR
jgi:diguanylate cyclase (GGDEF)-like protein